jgi:hypothetical protein
VKEEHPGSGDGLLPMKLKLIEERPACPVCNERWIGLCDCYEMRLSMETDDTRRSGEQTRLSLSWDAVLRESTWLVEARGEQ